MSETIIGVIIGGLIASIMPVITLISEHRRWKRETKLEYLKTERARLESTYEKTLTEFAEGMKKNFYSSNMTSDIEILFPKEISDKFWGFIADKDKSEEKCRNAYFELALAMKKSLKELDSQIRDTIEN